MSSLRANLNYGTFPIRTITEGLYGYRVEAKYAHPPLKSAAQSAKVFRKAIRLTAEQLLADRRFFEAAYAAAAKGKKFTADLLEYESKDVVIEAVAVVRAVRERDEAEREAAAAKARAEREAQMERERPTRETVLAAYDVCAFRMCRQGHDVVVEIGTRVAVESGVYGGERYSSRCTWKRQTSRHTLRVRADYLTRVTAVGPTTHAGMLVLDAEPVGFLPDGLRVVYRLTLARQGPGTGLEKETADVTVEGGRWVDLPRKADPTRMPAFALADYLQERDAADADTVRTYA